MTSTEIMNDNSVDDDIEAAQAAKADYDDDEISSLGSFDSIMNDIEGGEEEDTNVSSSSSSSKSGATRSAEHMDDNSLADDIEAQASNADDVDEISSLGSIDAIKNDIQEEENEAGGRRGEQPQDEGEGAGNQQLPHQQSQGEEQLQQGNEDPQQGEEEQREGKEEMQQEEGETRESSSTLTSEQVDRNRTLMTILHFVLTYPRWSVSLFVAFAMVAFPIPTVDEQVTSPWRDLQRLVQTEAELYHICVETGFHFRHEHLNHAIHAEQERTHMIQQKNQRIVQDAALFTSQCHNATIVSQRALQGWYDRTHLPLPLENNTATPGMICTADDQERLSNMLNEDLALAQDGVQDILDNYFIQSLASLQKMVDYSKQRAKYDYDYFIGIKFQSTLDFLDDFQAPGIHLTLPEQQIILDLRNILQGMIGTLNAAYVQIDLLSMRLGEFSASIDGFYVNYMDLYGRFASITAFVRDFVPRRIPLPSYFDISGLPTADMLLPSIFEIPKFDVDLPDIDVLTTDIIEKIIQLMSQVLRKAVEEASEQVQAIVEELIERLRELLTLEDYHPPKYPVSEEHPEIQSAQDEITYMNKLAEETKGSAVNILKRAQEKHDNFPQPEVVFPEMDMEAPTLTEGKQTRFSFLETSMPVISIPTWLVIIFGWILKRTVVLECFAQTIRLWRLKRKYEKNARPDLPDIDYASAKEDVDEEQGEDGSANNKTDNLDLIKAALVQHLSNPWVILGFMCIPVIFFVLIFWFPHVKDTCIDSRQGTFVARNVFTPILVNKANQNGNLMYTTSMMTCRQKQRAMCNQKSAETKAFHHNDLATLVALQTQFNESLSVLGVIDRCVDTASLDEQFATNCCGLDGYTVNDQECSVAQQPGMCPIDNSLSTPASFRPIGETITHEACNSGLEEWLLEDASFDCQVLEDTCKEVACDGVDANLILEMTIDADCKAEVYAIQLCMFVAMAVFHAIMINLMNTCMFNGLLISQWRSLSPDSIKFVTHVTEDGQLIKGSDKEERTARINTALQKFERLGKIQVALSAIFFFVWIVSFFALQKIAKNFTMYH